MSDFAFLEEFREPLLLVGDSIRSARLVFSAGKSRGLLRELSDVVANDGDAPIELFKRNWAISSPPPAATIAGGPARRSGR